MPSRRTLLLVPVLTLVACAAPPRLAAQPAPTPASLAALVEGYHADGEDLRRFYSVGGSPTRLERLARHGRAWAERLAALPEPDLGVAGRVDRLLVLADIAHDGALRERITARWQRAGELLAWADLVIELEEGRWTLTPFDPADTARRLDGLAATVEALTGRVTRAEDDVADEPAAEDGDANADASSDEADDAAPLPLSAVDGLWLAGEVTRLSGTLRTWHEQSRDFDPGHDWWLAAPYERAREALGALARTLREDVAGQHGRPDDPLVGDPIGADGLAADLAHELLPYSAAQLITLGRRELAWCTEQMEAAAAELGFDDWHEALEHVKGQHVEPGRQDDLVRAQANEAIAFLEERDLVTIPPLCRELWRLRMIGEETQRVLPFAAYSGQQMLVAFPPAGMRPSTPTSTTSTGSSCPCSPEIRASASGFRCRPTTRPTTCGGWSTPSRRFSNRRVLLLLDVIDQQAHADPGPHRATLVITIGATPRTPRNIEMHPRRLTGEVGQEGAPD